MVGGLCRYYAATIVGPMRAKTAQDLYVFILQLAPIVVKQRQQQQQGHRHGQQQEQLAQSVQADANIAIANCFFGIESIKEWIVAPQDFIQTAALIQQGIQEVSAHPGLPSAWPMLLWRLAALVNTCVRRGTVSPALTVTVASATTTALLRGATQLLCASPPLATEKGAAARGGASEAEAAWAASTALSYTRYALAAASMENEVKMAADAAATLIDRCSDLMTSPAAAGALQQRLHWLDSPCSYPRCLGGAGSAHSLLVYSLQASAEVVARYLTMRLLRWAPRAAMDALPGLQRQVMALVKVVMLPERVRTQPAASVPLLPPNVQTLYDVAKLLVHILDLVQGARGDVDSSWAETPAAASVVLMASALMSFAEHDGRCGSRLAEVDVSVPGCMQLAAIAASCFAGLAHQLRSGDSAAARVHAVLKLPGATTPLASAAWQLLQLLAWLSEPTTPVATSSAVLAKALPALATLAANNGMVRMHLAEGGGGQEWAPVAAALRRRLPRRMAARFLPDVDAVTAAVNTGREGGGDQDSPAALAAMATLNLQVQPALIFLRQACKVS